MTSHDFQIRRIPERYCSECKTRQVRRGQITCSPACRKKRQRRQEQARLALPLAMYELGKIRESIKRKERVPDFIADLNRLKAEINDLLLLAGDIDSVERNAMLMQRKMHI
ncbi:MAG: hypothetical protein GC179_08675 [Anaerolineaceae bacterium]|nr:hypothetical protein [Anaerolineaceae bacterium]